MRNLDGLRKGRLGVGKISAFYRELAGGFQQFCLCARGVFLARLDEGESDQFVCRVGSLFGLGIREGHQGPNLCY